MQMATLHVRNVPDDLYELLRERAAANDRSIGAETVQLLHERLALAGFGRPPRGFSWPGRRRPPGPAPLARFTPNARQAVADAREEARDLGHGHVGTDHLLVGVLQRAGAPVVDALQELGLTAEAARDAVSRTRGRGESTPKGRIPFEPGAKQTLELALRRSLKLGHTAIGLEHILLGVLDQETGPGAAILRNVEPDAEKVRSRVLRLFGAVEQGEVPPFRLERLPFFRVVELDGDAEAWEQQLNEACEFGYDLLEVVDRRAILRRA